MAGAFEAVAVEREFVDQLVQRARIIRDAKGISDYENLPVLMFLDVVYCLFESGFVVEELARCFEVFILDGYLVSMPGCVGNIRGPLLFAGR